MISPTHTLTVLGCGTSTGVPIAGCDCQVCTSADPFNARMKTSAWISSAAGASVLIDASTDLRHQALRAKISTIDAVLFTHAHSDHILGTEDLRPFSFRRKEPIPCYGTPETLAAIEKVFSYVFDPDPNYEGGTLARLSLVPLQDSLPPISIADLTAQPFRLRHGKFEVIGYRFGDLAYATDCNAIPDESQEIIHGVKTLILDALRFTPPHKTHFIVEDAIEVARALGAEQTYFIHMTHSVDYTSGNSQLPDGFAFAHDGLTVPFTC